MEGGARRGAGPQRWAGHERVRPSGQGRGGVGTGVRAMWRDSRGNFWGLEEGQEDVTAGGAGLATS